jgi:hypothetical protein
MPPGRFDENVAMSGGWATSTRGFQEHAIQKGASNNDGYCANARGTFAA